MAIDQDKLTEFLHKFVGDLGATMAAGNVLIGDRLGFYRTLAGQTMQPHELAARTGTATRFDKRKLIDQGTLDVASIRIWLRDPVP